MMAIASIGYDNTLTKLIVEIWEWGDISKKKSDRARNIVSQTMIQILNKPLG